MEDCVFCKIVQGQAPANIVYEDKEIIGFWDINPAAPVHILIVPKVHIADMTEINSDNVHLISKMHLAALKIAEDMGIEESGFRLVNNCKGDGGQIVWHLHYHLLGGKPLRSFA